LPLKYAPPSPSLADISFQQLPEAASEIHNPDPLFVGVVFTTSVTDVGDIAEQPTPCTGSDVPVVTLRILEPPLAGHWIMSPLES
jgi:hypothetical protein